MLQAKQEQQAAKRKALLNSLFEMWDNDGSGFLDTDEVLAVMKKYKDGMDNDHIDKGMAKCMFVAVLTYTMISCSNLPTDVYTFKS